MDNRKGGRGRRRDDNAQAIEKTIYINRVAKVVKGGRRFNFTSIVVVGTGEGKVGMGHGKANQVPEAIRKASERARKTMIEVPIVEGSIPHQVKGRFGAAKVVLLPAGPGTGIIAGSAVRAVCEAAGIKNILTKSFGSNNPVTLVKATINALEQLRTADDVQRLRGVEL